MDRCNPGCLQTLLILGLLVLGVCSSNPEAVKSQAPGRPEFPGKSFEKLRDKIKEQKTLNVMVGLKMEFAPEGKLPNVARQNQREAIQRAQSRLLSALSDTDVSLRGRPGTIPWISLTINEQAFKVLTNSPLVKTIKEVSVGKALLDESVPVVEGDTIHASGTRGDGTTLAILDSGLDIDHPAFDGDIADQACFSSTGDCPNGETVQKSGDAGVPIDGVREKDHIHGTHVGGIAAGQAVNSITLAPGVAPGASVITMMVFSDDDPASDDNTASVYADDVLLALDHLNQQLVDEHDVQAVNLSLTVSSSYYTSTCDGTYGELQSVIDSLRSKGVATFVASGNEDNADRIRAPACVSSAIAVGASDTSGTEELWTGGGGGTGTDRDADLLNLLAPGVGIVSAAPGNSTRTQTGTSMAAPHATGAWVLLQSRESSDWDLTNLLNTIKDNGNVITDSATGDTYPSLRIARACDDFMGSGDLDSNCYPGTVNITSPSDGSKKNSREITVDVGISNANTGDDLRLFREGDIVTTDSVSSTTWSPSLRLRADTNNLSVDVTHNSVRTDTDASSILLDQDLALQITSPGEGATVKSPPLESLGEVKGLAGDTLEVSLNGTKAEPFTLTSSGTLLDWERDLNYSSSGSKVLVAQLLDGTTSQNHVLLADSVPLTVKLPQTGNVALTSDYQTRRDNNEIKTFAAEENFGVMFISGSDNWTTYSSDPAFDPSQGEFLAVDHPNLNRATLEVLDREGNRVYQRTVRGGTRIRWDGQDDSGRTVSNGLYIIRVKVSLNTPTGTTTNTRTFPVMVLQ